MSDRGLAVTVGAAVVLVTWCSPGAYSQSKKADSPPRERRVDGSGDELPSEASARLGTLRFRCNDGFRSVTYTPDGRHLVTGGWGGARVWDAATGHLIRRIGNELPNPHQRADLSPDGKRVAVGGWGRDMGGAVYDLASGRRLYRFGAPSISVSARFSPDGKILAYYPRNDGAIVLLDAATGKELRALARPEPSGIFNFDPDVVFTPDSKTLIANAYAHVRFWDVSSGNEIRKIDAAADGVAEMALSPDGSMIATVAWRIVKGDKGQSTSFRSTEVTLWNAESGKELRRLSVRPLKKVEPEDQGPSSVAFTPDSRQLVTGGPEGALRVWDAATGKELRRLHHVGRLNGVAFGPRDRVAIIENYYSIRLRDFRTGRDLARAGGHRAPINALALSPDGRLVATADRDTRCILLWDAPSGVEKRRLDGETESFRSLFFSPDGARLFALDYANAIWIWDANSGERLHRLKRSRHAWCMALSPDGKTLALAGEDGEVSLFDAKTGAELRTLAPGAKGMAGLDFSPDGQTLLAWSADGRLHSWDTKTGRHVERDFYHLECAPFSAAFSPDGRLVTFGVQNSDFLPVVDLKTGQEVCRFALTEEPSQNLTWVAFSPDSRTLAWGGRHEGSVWLGELASGGVRHQLVGHRGRVQALAWSADGKTLVTGSADTTALVWDLDGRLPAEGPAFGALTAPELAACWNEFGDKDAKVAYAALRRSSADPSGAVAFLAECVKPVPAADAGRVAQLIADLEDASFAKRDSAGRELEKIGEPSLPALHKAAAGKPALEARRRLERLITTLESLTPERLQAIRAVEALELIRTAAARRLLRQLADGVREARLTREARESLNRLEGKK